MLRVSQITKRFGAVVALKDVDAEFVPGEVHAVLGENGAGKSTLMGVLSGFVKPDSGQVTLNGDPLPLGRAFEIKRLGIEMIHQHFTLVPAFTAEENLALAKLHCLKGVLSLETLTKSAQAKAAELGWTFESKGLIRNMPVGVQQRLEILKALSGSAEVLIFDEPTAVLSQDEVADLSRVLSALKADGKTVILIAHKLSEVLSIADRVTVLLRGIKVATASIQDVDAKTLANWMVGELPVSSGEYPQSLQGGGLQITGLTVLGDRGERSVNNVSLEVQRGEIFGIGGVDGNGQIELAEAIAQVRPPMSGQIRFSGEVLSDSDFKVAYIPQDRRKDGLALGLSVADNMLADGYKKESLRFGPFLIRKRVEAWSRDLIKRFSIKVESPRDLVSGLSGGNQQKVIVSRELDAQPDLIVAANPTRGLDIKATEYVHDRIREAAQSGAAVVLISADLDELGSLANQTRFLSRGELSSTSSAEALLGGAPA